MTIDRLDDAEIARMDVPGGAKAILRETGVPREVRLPGWEGSTLFSSNVEHGQVEKLGEAYVIGSVRETMGTPAVYAYYRLERDGSVVVVDVRVDGRLGAPRTANASLGSFFRSLGLFVDYWARLASASNPGALVTELRSRILEIDAHALDTDDGLWPRWLAEVDAQEE